MVLIGISRQVRITIYPTVIVIHQFSVLSLMILLTLATSCICFWFPLELPYIRHFLDVEAYAVKCMLLIARVWADSRVDFALVIFELLLFMHILL